MEIDFNLFHRLFRAHPWHGVSIGDQAPELVTAYIEITPYDLVKYEVDKETGYLRVDRRRPLHGRTARHRQQHGALARPADPAPGVVDRSFRQP